MVVADNVLKPGVESKHELFGFVRGGFTTWLPVYMQMFLCACSYILHLQAISIYFLCIHIYHIEYVNHCKSGSRVLICFSLVRMLILLLFTLCRTGMHRVCVECPCLAALFNHSRRLNMKFASTCCW